MQTRVACAARVFRCTAAPPPACVRTGGTLPLRRVRRYAARNNLRRVSAVTLELGEVSGIISSYLADCWNWACAKNDLMRGADLVIEEVPAVTSCEARGQAYGTVEHGRVCPHCGSGRTYLVQGDESVIKEIATPDEEGPA